MIDIELIVKIAAGITAVAGAVAIITKVIKRTISIAIHDEMKNVDKPNAKVKKLPNIPLNWQLKGEKYGF